MNRTILFQVTAPAILTGLLLVSACLGSAWSLHRLQVNLGRILTDNVASVQASLDLESRMRQMRYHSLLYLTRPTPEGLKNIEQTEEAFEEAYHHALAAANGPGEKKYLDDIDKGFQAYRLDMADLRAQVAVRGPMSDFAALAETHPIRHIVEPCHELGRLNREQLERTVEDSNKTSERARTALLLLGLGGPAGGLLCGYGLVRGLTRSIARLKVRVQAVAERLDREGGAPAAGPLLSAEDEEDQAPVNITIKAEGDLVSLDRQLEHVLRRVEEVTARLQRQHQEIRRAEQLAALGKLAAGVAHEIRNPLTGMKLLIEAALHPRRRHPLSEEDLRVIRDEIARVERTVQHFLDFARPPALKRQPVDLREVVRGAHDLVRARAPRQGVSLELDLPPEPVVLSLDPGQVGTVVVNLLLNALDAMPSGGRVTIRLVRKEAQRTCRLVIQDTGPGIPPEVAGRLFTPFVSSKPTGTGLGLALSRTIVAEHGGTITGENVSAGGKESGAAFTVELPLE